MPSDNSLFQALADPTRREILRLLRRADMTPGEMALHFSMSKPSLSHHLDMLKRADLVTARREGQNIRYSLNTSVFEEVTSMVLDLFHHVPKEAL